MQYDRWDGPEDRGSTFPLNVDACRPHYIRHIPKSIHKHMTGPFFSDSLQYRHISPYIAIYRHISPYISIYRHISSYIAIYLHISPYIAIYIHISLYIAIYRHISPYISIYRHISPYMLLNIGANLTRWGVTEGIFRLSFLAEGQGYFYEVGEGGQTMQRSMSSVGNRLMKFWLTRTFACIWHA